VESANAIFQSLDRGGRGGKGGLTRAWRVRLASLVTLAIMVSEGGCRDSRYNDVGDLTRQLEGKDVPWRDQDHHGERWNMGDGIELSHFSEGRGEPVLIVHGGPSEPYRKAWDGLRPLTGRYTFHYYDQRGCGDSTRPIDRFEKNSWSEDLPVLRKKLGVEAHLMDIERIRRILGQDRLILVGHSYGAFVAALYTMEFPTRVKKLVMVSPAPHIVWNHDVGGVVSPEVLLPQQAMVPRDFSAQAKY
jgi:pimeloyl-ACP methyl ester carboxylesterase